MFETNTGFTLSGETKDDRTFEMTGERRGPDEEAIDAFVLTFRYFIQDNEKSSFRNLAKYYENDQINAELKNEFSRIRKEINGFLDKSGGIAIHFNNERLTKRKIMDIFIYGGLSHSSDETKKNMYDMWMAMPPLKPMIENEFVYTLSTILKGISAIKEINQETLKELMN